MRLRLLTAAVVLSAAVSAVIALPLLPARDLQGSIVMAINPAQGETVGWPRLVRTVAIAWHQMPAAERDHSAIFTANYGDAGAIDLLGSKLGLPQPFSGHDGFSRWERPAAGDTQALLVGFDSPADVAPYFDRCRTLARVDNGVGLNNDEQGLPVMLCRVAGSWSALWPRLTHYD